jgi:hypothetical protein
MYPSRLWLMGGWPTQFEKRDAGLQALAHKADLSRLGLRGFFISDQRNPARLGMSGVSCIVARSGRSVTRHRRCGSTPQWLSQTA